MNGSRCLAYFPFVVYKVLANANKCEYKIVEYRDLMRPLLIKMQQFDMLMIAVTANVV